MPNSAEGIRGIRTLPNTGGLTAAETAFVTAETASGIWVHNETPTGSINSSNVTFTLANAPTSTSVIWLYRNGILLKYGASNDFTISSSTITTNQAPESGDILLCTYRK